MTELIKMGSFHLWQTFEVNICLSEEAEVFGIERRGSCLTGVLQPSASVEVTVHHSAQQCWRKARTPVFFPMKDGLELVLQGNTISLPPWREASRLVLWWETIKYWSRLTLWLRTKLVCISSFKGKATLDQLIHIHDLRETYHSERNHLRQTCWLFIFLSYVKN